MRVRPRHAVARLLAARPGSLVVAEACATAGWVADRVSVA